MVSNEQPELSKVAKDIVNLLAAIVRTSQIHDPSNIAVVNSVDKFVAMINPLIAREGSITLELVGEYFYINETRIKFSMEYLLSFDTLMREFKKHKLGSITFKGAITAEDMRIFLKAFIASSFSDTPFETLSEGIEDVESLSVGVLRKIKDEAGDQDIRKVVRRTYFNAVSFTKGVMSKVKAGEKINVKRAKRVVESMVDLILDQEELLVGMTAIKDYDEYTYHHSVNVSVLAIALGQRLGLPKKSLLELGLVALFHDIGKTEVPIDVLNKPTAFTDEEWRIMKQHPLWGVRSILKMKGFDVVSVRAAIVAFEHHIRHDPTGYPKTMQLSELDLYSRIVSIADQYDSMTSARVYSRNPLPPDRALSIMMERAGAQLDPLLLKFFINMVGVFPVGTLVMLNTKELGLVYSSNAMLPDRPRVMVIMDSEGRRVPGYIVDLAEKKDGKYTRTIMKTMDPNKYRINLAEYML
jgi:HD-GYP domain-containing protein (c-di-GMP phosphodiesterase class II)